MAACSVEGCENPAEARGMCDTHYQRMRRHGTLEVKPPAFQTHPCDIDGCDKTALARGLCSAHYHRWRRSKVGEISDKPVRQSTAPPRGTCGIDGCEAPHKARGMCRNHYKRWQKGWHP